MQQSPSQEAESHAAIQEIPHFFQNLKVHYHVHKSLPKATPSYSVALWNIL